MIKRKFLAEGGLHLYSSGANVIRPSDLYKYSNNEQVRAALTLCNIYIIGRRPKISVCPTSLKVVNGLVHGNFRVHLEYFQYESFAFSQKHAFFRGNKPIKTVNARTDTPFGSNIQILDEQNQETNIPAYVMVANSNHGLDKNADIEVLYIGQGYGKTGNRLAIDRLLAHSTLQRIMAETAQFHPDQELLLLMFRYEHARNLLSSAGDFSVDPIATDEESSQYISHVGNYKLDRKSRITLAEAALINYFKPPYNMMHIESFKPNSRIKTLEKILKADLSALIVEIDTSNISSKLYSKHIPTKKLESILSHEQISRIEAVKLLRDPRLPSSKIEEFIKNLTHVHIANFSLYSPEERETFLNALVIS